MSRLWREHPKTLNMQLDHVGAATSAVRWMEAMEPADRVQAMNFFCHKCGELLGQDQPIVVGATKKNPCPKCD
jgi:hypothetical protein